MGIAYIWVILLLRIVQNFCSKRSSQLFPASMLGQAQYMACLFAISFLLGGIAMCFDPVAFKPDGGMLVIAAVSGATLVLAQLCMLLAMQSGTMVIVTAFATAGLIVPCIAGMLFMGERMSFWQWLGVALFIAASYLLGRSAKVQNGQFNQKTVLLLIGALLANGGTMLCQKLFTFPVMSGEHTASCSYGFERLLLSW